MPRCPQCNKNLVEIVPRCPSCQADLALLIDYVSHLQGGLERAENLTKAGELGQAVWAYLEVLEVDPDNPAARRQVGQVATAVRQFDYTVPGRRWAHGLGPPREENGSRWLWHGLVILALCLAFALGYFMGSASYDDGDPGDRPKPTPTLRDNKQLGK